MFRSYYGYVTQDKPIRNARQHLYYMNEVFEDYCLNHTCKYNDLIEKFRKVWKKWIRKEIDL